VVPEKKNRKKKEGKFPRSKKGGRGGGCSSGRKKRNARAEPRRPTKAWEKKKGKSFFESEGDTGTLQGGQGREKGGGKRSRGPGVKRSRKEAATWKKRGGRKKVFSSVEGCRLPGGGKRGGDPPAPGPPPPKRRKVAAPYTEGGEKAKRTMFFLGRENGKMRNFQPQGGGGRSFAIREKKSFSLGKGRGLAGFAIKKRKMFPILGGRRKNRRSS